VTASPLHFRYVLPEKIFNQKCRRKEHYSSYSTKNRLNIMELLEEIDTIIEEVKDEANNLKTAESKEEEKEALKEMLDALMRGARQVQEKLDQFNDRRYR
jgi:hypothetical protein